VYESFVDGQMALEDGQVQANVHITPMRASRALALRYLATKFSTDTENIAVSFSCQDPMHRSPDNIQGPWGFGFLQRNPPSYQRVWGA
jgi:hypothetical protein